MSHIAQLGAATRLVDCKGRGVRVHKAINRTLATVALLLSIIVLLALVVFGVRVVQALNDVGKRPR
jgi:hypothetical protein